MLQEQISTYLEVKSFKRKYPGELFFFFFFFFDSVLCPFQAFSLISRQINLKLGRKLEYLGKNHLTHPQAELGLSHVNCAPCEVRTHSGELME